MANDETTEEAIEEAVPRFSRFKRPAPDAVVEVAVPPAIVSDLTVVANELLEAVEALPEPEPDPYGYVVSTWGGSRKFQCMWCPWDVVESISGDYDITDRMQLHLDACHKGEDGPAKYGSNGLPLPQGR